MLLEDLKERPELTSREVVGLVEQGMRGFHERRLARLSDSERELLDVTAVTASGINFWRLEHLGMGTKQEAAELTRALLSKGLIRRTYPGAACGSSSVKPTRG